MRALLLFVSLVAFAGCGNDTLEDTTYRRLLDQYDTYDQCLESVLGNCYQTLTFCADGSANANLDVREEGTYVVRDDSAVAKLLTATVIFDLETQSSAQLPGRHAWELVDPQVVDCAP
jgi:hypothetical protein